MVELDGIINSNKNLFERIAFTRFLSQIRSWQSFVHLSFLWSYIDSTTNVKEKIYDKISSKIGNTTTKSFPMEVIFSNLSHIFYLLWYGFKLQVSQIGHQRYVLLLLKIFEQNISEAMFEQLQSLTTKLSEMHLVPNNLHKLILVTRIGYREINFANPKSQICCRKNVFEYLTLLFSYYCRISLFQRTFQKQ